MKINRYLLTFVLIFSFSENMQLFGMDATNAPSPTFIHAVSFFDSLREKISEEEKTLRQEILAKSKLLREVSFNLRALQISPSRDFTQKEIMFLELEHKNLLAAIAILKEKIFGSAEFNDAIKEENDDQYQLQDEVSTDEEGIFF
ncbi:hypothetical protein FJ364_00545 [Candidatus Dependentiae bacterium]|nr:hypothetical protein [Candidatus Dependentiae bacterium]